MLLTLHHMGFIFVNLSDVLEHLVMLQISTLIINFLNKPICIINFANVFLSSIADALLNGRHKSMLRQGLSEPDFCSNLVIN